MKQLTTIDYNVSAAAGNCLWFSQEMMGVPHKYDYAWAAYNATMIRHSDTNFPAGVAVPIWFYWKNKLPGDTVPFEYGHAAVATPSGIYSSPLSGVGRKVFGSVDELVRAFGGGIRYVGWSEDISGVKIITNEEEKIMIDQNHLNALTMAYFNRGPLDQETTRYVGKAEYARVIEDFDNSPEYKAKQQADYQNADIAAAGGVGFVPVSEQLFKKK